MIKKKEIRKKIGERLRDNHGYAITTVVILIIYGAVLLFGIGFVWWIMANMVTIGIGFAYIALGICMLMGTGVLMLWAYKTWIAKPRGA